MGQYSILGRYPFHWHLVGDARGQYFNNSTIINSFNRCVTVHGTDNTVVSDNVCYGHWGHGYFLEDGIEEGNTFDHNLGLLGKRHPEGDELIKSDNDEGVAAKGPATFWISNGNNIFTNNSAAGSEGIGYWYDTKDVVTGPSAGYQKTKGYNPNRSRFGVFKDNRAHSSKMSMSLCKETGGPTGYEPPGGGLIENLTVFSTGGGSVWPCKGYHRFERLKVLDTGGSIIHLASYVSAQPAFINNGLFVSNSALANGNYRSRAAFGLYDFGTEITKLSSG